MCLMHPENELEYFQIVAIVFNSVCFKYTIDIQRTTSQDNSMMTDKKLK